MERCICINNTTKVRCNKPVKFGRYCGLHKNCKNEWSENRPPHVAERSPSTSLKSKEAAEQPPRSPRPQIVSKQGERKNSAVLGCICINNKTKIRCNKPVKFGRYCGLHKNCKNELSENLPAVSTALRPASTKSTSLRPASTKSTSLKPASTTSNQGARTVLGCICINNKTKLRCDKHVKFGKYCGLHKNCKNEFADGIPIVSPPTEAASSTALRPASPRSRSLPKVEAASRSPPSLPRESPPSAADAPRSPIALLPEWDSGPKRSSSKEAAPRSPTALPRESLPQSLLRKLPYELYDFIIDRSAASTVGSDRLSDENKNKFLEGKKYDYILMDLLTKPDSFISYLDSKYFEFVREKGPKYAYTRIKNIFDYLGKKIKKIIDHHAALTNNEHKISKISKILNKMIDVSRYRYEELDTIHSIKYLENSNYKNKTNSSILIPGFQISLQITIDVYFILNNNVPPIDAYSIYLSYYPYDIDATLFSRLHTLYLIRCSGSINNIESLKNLHTLSLTNNMGVNNVNSLGGLHTLNLSGCKNVTDVSSLSRLHTLNLSDTNVTDVSYLGGLHTLNLSNCLNVTDFRRLDGVHKLNLSNTNITDVSVVGGVYDLNLSNCSHVTNFGVLGGVHKLNLSNTNITDVRRLGGVHKLNLSRTNVIDVNALGNVHTLDLSYNRVDDVSNLGGVHTLNLSHCPNITDVRNLSKVNTLNLKNCGWNGFYSMPVDISTLMNVPNLDITRVTPKLNQCNCIKKSGIRCKNNTIFIYCKMHENCKN